MSYCINPECYHQSTSNFCPICGTPLDIKGRYRLIRPLRELNKSPYIEVFEVDDKGEKKVIKILKSQDKTVLRLFEREAEVLKTLTHQGIPKIDSQGYFTFKIPSTQRQLHCLVIEKIEGQDLEQFLQKHKSISETLAINWLKQLTKILDRVHQEKLFHRDIKPANIMLKPDRKLVLIDFGAARWVTETVFDPKRDVTGVLTPGYAAPEQEDFKALPQSDFFALGRTFVHLVTGKHPYYVVRNASTGRFTWREDAPQISEPLADFIDELMAPKVENRPQNTQEILQRLDEIDRLCQPPAPPPSLPKVYRWVLILGLPMTLLLGIAIGKIQDIVSPSLSTACDSPALDTSQIAFSPNGKYLVQASLDKTLRVFDTAKLNNSDNKQAQIDCKLHNDGVVAVQFSPNGEKIATASLDATARLWKINSKGIEEEFNKSHEYPVIGLDFSKDGNYLASASADGIARIWNTKNGERMAIKNNGAYIKAISFSKNQNNIAIASLNNLAKVWNWQTQKQAQNTIPLKPNNLIATEFSPTDNKYLASASDKGIAQIWDTTNFRRIAQLNLQTYPMAIAFSPNGKHLVAIGLEDNVAVVWNWENHKTDNIKISLRHNDRDNLVAVAFPQDQNYVATASSNGYIILWDINNGDRLKTCNSDKGLVEIAFNPQDSNQIAVANADGKLNLIRCEP